MISTLVLPAPLRGGPCDLGSTVDYHLITSLSRFYVVFVCFVFFVIFATFRSQLRLGVPGSQVVFSIFFGLHRRCGL